jgi:hypothetical protein
MCSHSKTPKKQFICKSKSRLDKYCIHKRHIVGRLKERTKRIMGRLLLLKTKARESMCSRDRLPVTLGYINTFPSLFLLLLIKHLERSFIKPHIVLAHV